MAKVMGIDLEQIQEIAVIPASRRACRGGTLRAASRMILFRAAFSERKP